MTTEESKLFWDIIGCPCFHTAPKDACHRIIATQNGNSCWQVPEPWNGSLSEKFLIIAGNPAIDIYEMYPSTVNVGSLAWVTMGTSKLIWGRTKVEDFFNKRFGYNICTAFGTSQPYVKTVGPCILQVDGTYKQPKNNYWEIYNKICTAIDSSFAVTPWRYAITDIVHCKSSSSQGLTSATYSVCVNHTRKIVDLFIKLSQSDSPVVVLVGSSANRYISMLFSGNYASATIGSYNYTRNKVTERKDIVMREYLCNGKKVKVICEVPAPSKANGQMSDIVINGQKIW